MQASAKAGAVLCRALRPSHHGVLLWPADPPAAARHGSHSVRRRGRDSVGWY